MDNKISWLAAIAIIVTYCSLGFATLICVAGYSVNIAEVKSAVQECSLSASVATMLIAGYVVARSVELSLRACTRN